jgi:hypothetical protein
VIGPHPLGVVHHQPRQTLMFRFVCLASLLGVTAVAACSSSVMPQPPAAVNFVLVAPLCSSVLPVQLSIDGLIVATDTFRVSVANPHTLSRDFAVTAGPHALSARVIGGYVWPSQTMTLIAGATATDSLPFYCS